MIVKSYNKADKAEYTTVVLVSNYYANIIRLAGGRWERRTCQLNGESTGSPNACKHYLNLGLFSSALRL
jgi:hypothetical protein